MKQCKHGTILYGKCRQCEREMHIRVTTPLGEGAIYISNTALQAMGKKQAEHYLTHVVAGDIAKYIVKQQGR